MCIYCKGRLETGETDYLVNRNNHVIMVRDTPCEKCIQCGEVYFNDNTVTELKNILDGVQSISSEISLTVLSYGKSLV